MDVTPADTPTRMTASPRGRTAVAVGIGNFMEWFDFAIYGFFAAMIGELFFPATTPVVALLSSLSVFAVAFVMRPLGAFVLGPVGDKHGRKAVLVLSVLLMGAATTLIGLLPSYEQVGVLAPLALVVLRCVQGIAAGGEWSGSAAYLVENAPDNRRGLYASLISGTAALAFLVGSAVALVLSVGMAPEALLSWGWRVPFLLAAPLSLIGLYIRLRLGDTPAFEKLREEEAVNTSPLRRVGRRDLKPLMVTFACSSVSGVGIYYLATYVNNHLTSVLEIERTTGLALSGVGLFLYLLMCPLVGALSDRIGRRRLNVIGTVGFVLLSVPAFALMSGRDAVGVVLGLVIFGACQALCSVTNVVLLVELFPADTRSSGSALGYNLGLLVAGPGPLVAAALVNAFGTTVAPAWYPALVALLAAPVLIKWLPETYRRDITTN